MCGGWKEPHLVSSHSSQLRGCNFALIARGFREGIKVYRLERTRQGRFNLHGHMGVIIHARCKSSSVAALRPPILLPVISCHSYVSKPNVCLTFPRMNVESQFAIGTLGEEG